MVGVSEKKFNIVRKGGDIELTGMIANGNEYLGILVDRYNIKEQRHDFFILLFKDNNHIIKIEFTLSWFCELDIKKIVKDILNDKLNEDDNIKFDIYRSIVGFSFPKDRLYFWYYKLIKNTEFYVSNELINIDEFIIKFWNVDKDYYEVFILKFNDNNIVATNIKFKEKGIYDSNTIKSFINNEPYDKNLIEVKNIVYDKLLYKNISEDILDFVELIIMGSKYFEGFKALKYLHKLGASYNIIDKLLEDFILVDPYIEQLWKKTSYSFNIYLEEKLNNAIKNNTIDSLNIPSIIIEGFLFEELYNPEDDWITYPNISTLSNDELRYIYDNLKDYMEVELKKQIEKRLNKAG